MQSRHSSRTCQSDNQYGLYKLTEYNEILNYLQKEEIIHSDFWELHKKIIGRKADLRQALNRFSEAFEALEEPLHTIMNLIERDREIKRRNNMTAKIEVVVEGNCDPRDNQKRFLRRNNIKQKEL